MASAMEHRAISPENEPVHLFADSKSYEMIETQLKYELMHNAESFVKDKDLVPHYSEKHKVGFFSLDRSSQTDITDVVNIKEMAIVVNGLIKDIAAIKKDIIIAKQIMMADYKSIIQKKATELYVRVNSRVADLENMHKDKVDVIRRAYKQQLNDALISMRTLYQNKLDSQLRHVHKLIKEDEGSGDIGELRATVARSESVISMLQIQLEAARAQANRPPPIEEEVMSESDGEIGRLQMIIEELREANYEMDNRINVLEDDLSLKDTSLSDIKNQLARSKETNEKLYRTIEKMKVEKEQIIAQNLKNDSARLERERKKLETLIRAELQREMEKAAKLKAEADQAEAERQQQLQLKMRQEKKLKRQKPGSAEKTKKSLKAEVLPSVENSVSGPRSSFIEREDQERLLFLESQRVELQQTIERRVREMEEEIRRVEQEKEKDRERLTTMYQKRIREVEEQLKEALMGNSELEMKLSTMSVATTSSAPKPPAKAVPKVQTIPGDSAALRAEIERLKRELERVHKVWEKKFSVLQLSLHALKDESYVRHTMQRHSAALHHIDLKVKLTGPGNLQIKSGTTENVVPKSAHLEDDRFTTAIKTDELQIMESNSLPRDVACLPQPPASPRSPPDMDARNSDGIVPLSH